MAIEIDPSDFPWGRRVVSTSPHSEGESGAIDGRGITDHVVLVSWDMGGPGFRHRTWASASELDWED